ncbi:hypothetical protein FPRO06_09063 [Fusarium proliferatum]|nr:hypothetical protein FPRO06_09063 [Fusarium proliferatum]
MQIPPELKAVVQTYWNALHAEFTADRSGLEKWRVMQCVLEAASALRSLVAALSNPCRTTLRNRTGIAPVIQAQELASNQELLTLSYRGQARPEIHNTKHLPNLLERLPTAFEMPLEGDNSRKRAKFPSTELPDKFIDDMDRLVAEGGSAARSAWPGPTCKSRHFKDLSSRKSDGPGPSDEEDSGGLQVLGGFSHSLASSPVLPTSAGFAIKSIRVFPLPIILDCLIPGVDDALPQLITSFQPTNPTVPSPVASLRPLGHLFAVTSPLAIVENSCSNPNGGDSPRIMTPDPSRPTTGRQASSPNVPLRTHPPVKHR